MDYKRWVERMVRGIFKICRCYAYRHEGDPFLLITFPRFEIYVLSIDSMNSYLFYRDYESGDSHEFNLHGKGYFHYDAMVYIISELQTILKFKNLRFEDRIATSIKLNIETTGTIYNEGKCLFVWRPLMIINHDIPKHPNHLENFINGPGWVIIKAMKEVEYLCSDKPVRVIQRYWKKYKMRREWALRVIEEFAFRPNHILYKKVMSRYITRDY